MNALKILLFVTVMGLVSGALLVGVNQWTAPLIAKNEEVKLKSAVLDVLEIPYSKDDVFAVFNNNVKALEVSGYQFYKSSNGSTAFEFSGPGLWGHIYGLASINPGLKAIKAIVILHQEETPGLGARIAEGAFLKQFRGKEFLPKLLFVAEGKSSANNEVDAITGATGSSRALEKLLNETLEKNVSLLSEKNAQESRKEKF